MVAAKIFFPPPLKFNEGFRYENVEYIQAERDIYYLYYPAWYRKPAEIHEWAIFYGMRMSAVSRANLSPSKHFANHLRCATPRNTLPRHLKCELHLKSSTTYPSSSENSFTSQESFPQTPQNDENSGRIKES